VIEPMVPTLLMMLALLLWTLPKLCFREGVTGIEVVDGRVANKKGCWDVWCGISVKS
jgi:hypothetical protein